MSVYNKSYVYIKIISFNTFVYVNKVKNELVTFLVCIHNCIVTIIMMSDWQTYCVLSILIIHQKCFKNKWGHLLYVNMWLWGLRLYILILIAYLLGISGMSTGGEMNYNTHWEFFYTSREIDQVRFFLLPVFFFLASRFESSPHYWDIGDSLRHTCVCIIFWKKSSCIFMNSAMLTENSFHKNPIFFIFIYYCQTLYNVIVGMEWVRWIQYTSM